MGAGDDTFVWDPGDGSDTVEGQAGTDTMLFNGASVAEKIDLSANGERLRFFRDPANIIMDTNDVETVDFNALGGADTITVNDLTGTDVPTRQRHLAGTPGAAATPRRPRHRQRQQRQRRGHRRGTSNGAVVVTGLSATVNVTNAEPTTDTLAINALAGNDAVDAARVSANSILLTLDGGAGDDVLIGGGGNDTLFGRDGDDVRAASCSGRSNRAYACFGSGVASSALAPYACARRSPTPGRAAARPPTAHRSSGSRTARRRRPRRRRVGPRRDSGRKSHGRRSRSAPSTSWPALPGQHQERLLLVLGVVEAVRLARLQDAEVDPEQGTFSLPPRSYEYKAALNDDVGRELRPPRACSNGPNIPTSVATTGNVKFYYDHKSHWATDNRSAVIATAVGKLPGRGRLLRRLGPDVSSGRGSRHRRRRDIHVRDDRPAARLVRGQGRDQRGLGGELRRGRHPRRRQHRLQRPVRRHEGHLLVCLDHAHPDDHRGGRPRRARRSRCPVALRPCAEGLPRHRSQHHVQGLVHGRRRRPERRLLPDRRQHEPRDAPVHRHRRLDLHRPPDPRHDL